MQKFEEGDTVHLRLLVWAPGPGADLESVTEAEPTDAETVELVDLIHEVAGSQLPEPQPLTRDGPGDYSLDYTAGAAGVWEAVVRASDGPLQVTTTRVEYEVIET